MRQTLRRGGVVSVGVIAAGLVSLVSDAGSRQAGLFETTASAQRLASVTVMGVIPNQSSARVVFQPVAGAKDYRIYDVAAPTDVKYAGQVHLEASAGCPGAACLNHFALQADGVTLVFPYQVAAGGSGGPQALDVAATDIEWNGLADGQPHTMVVEAVDQLGPVPQANLYAGTQNTPLVNPLPVGAMLGSNKGKTNDGNVSTNGQGPYIDTPQVIGRSAAFVVQGHQEVKAIPSRLDAAQAFYDTFETAEGGTIRQVARQDSTTDSYGNLGTMTYSMNAGSAKAWTLEYRQADNQDSMPFISNDHFMDMLFDGATPNTSAPTHTIYGSMSMTPSQQTIDMSNGKVAHLTMEVDAHQSFRRWLAFDLAPANDPLQSWEPGLHPINGGDQGLFLEFKDGGCTLDVFTGPTSGSDRTPVGTAGGSGHGARLWGQAGSVGGAPIMCGLGQLYNPSAFSSNGLGLDDRSRFDLFVSQSHAALFEDGRLVVQSDIPAGSFPWASVPLKAYYSHYLYHSDNDITDLEQFQVNGVGLCYPLNSYWFNNPVSGTPASQDVCNASYPAGYGFPHSDERHWDNMGFEVLPTSAVPGNSDYSVFGALAQLPQAQAPQFTSGGQAATSTPTATSSPTLTSVPANTPTSTPVASASTSTPTPLATSTPEPLLLVAAPTYSSAARVTPAAVQRGGKVRITTSVTCPASTAALIDVEVHDATGAKVFQRWWDNQAFNDSQPHTYATTWSVPSTLAPGTYTVKIGTFAPGWTSLYAWNDAATTITVK